MQDLATIGLSLLACLAVIGVAGFRLSRFGDAELPASLPLDQVSWVVSALSDVGANCAFMAAHSEADAHLLKKAGAEREFHPYKNAADYAAAERQHTMQQNQP